jgi:probable selenium-dependent hydroxylase accessory protein YqeC
VLVYCGSTPSGRKLSGLAPELVDALSQSGEFDRILVEADGSARKPLKAAASHEPVIASATDLLIAVAGLNALGLPLNEESVFRAEIWARLTGTELGSPVSAESIAGMALHPDGFFKGRPPGARSTLFLNRADSPERQAAAKRISDLLAASGARAPDRVAFGALLDAMRDRRH